jgi:predicted dehydrogenase
MRTMNVALLGTNFMGRVHSNAWAQVGKFFGPGITPVMKVVCGRDALRTADFARTWGWAGCCSDWRAVMEMPDIDIIDIALPTHLHHPVAIAAAQAGKHVFCEKPMATTATHAEQMLAAARSAGIVHYINHNYLRLPAVMYAKRLIDTGRLGRIFHWRGAYQQDWIMSPDFPLSWHLRQELAGSGPHADLNAHSVDLAHFLVGEIASVSCLTAGFIRERPLPGSGSATFSAGAVSQARGPVTVEDASLMMVEFAQGALGSFEATRFANGRRNRHAFEIYGSDGALCFDLERLNDLEFYDGKNGAEEQGFRTIQVTQPTHPYLKHWWPPGHVIGYEHTFIHAVGDFLAAIADGGGIAPDFEDGLRVMTVLDAGLRSAADGRKQNIPPVPSRISEVCHA